MQEQGFGVRLLLSASKDTRLWLAFLASFASSVWLSPKLTVNTRRCARTKQARGRCSHKRMSNWELELPLRRVTVSRTECQTRWTYLSVCRVSCGLCGDWRSIIFRLVSAQSFPRCPCPWGQVAISHDAVWFALCEKRCRKGGKKQNGQMTREMILIGNIICLEFLKLSERVLFCFVFFSSTHRWFQFSLFGDAFAISVKKPQECI